MDEMKIEGSQKVVVEGPVTFEEISGVTDESRSVLVEMVTIFNRTFVNAFVVL